MPRAIDRPRDQRAKPDAPSKERRALFERLATLSDVRQRLVKLVEGRATTNVPEDIRRARLQQRRALLLLRRVDPLAAALWRLQQLTAPPLPASARRAEPEADDEVLGVRMCRAFLDETPLAPINRQRATISPLLAAARSVRWYRGHLPGLLLAAGRELRALEDRHDDQHDYAVVRPRRRLRAYVRTARSRELQREAVTIAASAEGLAKRLRHFGPRVSELLKDELSLDHEEEDVRWLHDAWQLTTDEERLPAAGDISRLLEQLERLATDLRAAATNAPSLIAPRGRRGTPRRSALERVRRAMLTHAPRQWTGAHKARVIAAALFASGLVPRFTPDSERRTLARLGQIARGAKNS